MNRAANSSGPTVSRPATVALSSIGISAIIPCIRSGAATATSSETFAPSEVPPTTAFSTSRWSSNPTVCSAKAGIE
jgi:hypothetical protein